MRLRSIGKAQVAGLCIGGNPFSGFSHQTEERSRQMRAYYTDERIHRTLRLAEASGINTFFGRTDDHIFQVLRTYWEQGGRIQWFAQVCTVAGDPDSWRQWLEGAARLGAAAAYLHGGVVDPGGEVGVPAGKPGLTRVGAEKCRLCHKVQHASWATTAHARRTPPLDCEGCHGPGSEYKALAVMKDPVKAKAAGLVEPDAPFCGRCHKGKWDPAMLGKVHAHKSAS